MDLGLYDLALEGGGAQTKWRRQHGARQRQKLQKQHRAEAKETKAKALKAAKADLKARRAKWLKGWTRKAAAAKAAGLPKPSKKGRPWRLGNENPQVIDMVGRVFGRLTVVRSAPVSLTMKQSQRCRVWVVKCSCGSPEYFANGSSLRRGNSNSCGCLMRELMRASWRSGGVQRKRVEKILVQRAKPLSHRLRVVRGKIKARHKLTKYDVGAIVEARRVVRLWEIEKGLVKPRKRGGPCR